ncbi:hypothetical protein N9A94_09290, partial [Akkermansiaceae bacterium]|nr:hypothetical protein [Akkermansiaceae bacterium]
NPTWGIAENYVIRLFPNDYTDGASSPSGEDRPSARAVSNALATQEESILNSRGASDFLWQWGQFVDHDIIETPTVAPAEPFDIEVPTGDVYFDPFGTGEEVIPLNRSLYEEVNGVREQVNAISAYLDGSGVYGSDDPRAFALRRLDGSGKLKTTESDHGDLLPYNEGGFDNAPHNGSNLFLAGDVRANEQAGLLAMHTLFVREHNHWADRFAEMNPQAMDEEIYQFARMIVSAEIQAITYREFLPVLLGRDALPPYQGYRDDVRADISNEFGAAAYRFGHTLLSPNLLRLDAEGNEIEAGHLSLAAAFFNPALVEDEGIDSLLRGLASQQCQELDEKVIDEVRNLLFGPPGSGGFDLASLNIQRGRDHGLPGYNDTRRALRLPPARLFSDISDDREVIDALSQVYDSPEQLDLWITSLCEDPVPGSMVGPCYQRILVDQFVRLRDGDRFYYEGALPGELVTLVEQQTLAIIIRRNAGIGAELPDNVFIVDEASSQPQPRRHPQRTRDTGGRQQRQAPTGSR